MRVLITGATGFIGKALCQRLLKEGHEITALVRSVDKARDVLGPEVNLVQLEEYGEALRNAVNGQDAVINLAGEPIFGKRWNKYVKVQIFNSRVVLTRKLVDAISEADQKPTVFLSASGVGYYGDRVDEELDEETIPSNDFAGHLSQSWEAAASRAEEYGLRTVIFRIGMVLGLGGGALDVMLPIFKRGLGGKLGSGKQYMSWIHLDDIIEIFITALKDSEYTGPINAVAPNPVTNKEFTKTLGKILKKPTILGPPAMVLKLAFGEVGKFMLASQKAVPKKLQALGFKHRFTNLEEALKDII